METKVLTEVGTNELEVLLFTVSGESYAINVAKVKKLNTMDFTIVKVPNAHESVEGLINYFGDTIPLINLRNVLGLKKENTKEMLLVTEFSGKTVSFVVEDIQGIHRTQWDKLESADDFMKVGADYKTVTSILKKDSSIVSVLDFESIIDRVLGGSLDDDIESIKNTISTNKTILFAEDSGMLSKILGDKLKDIGFTNIKSFIDGKAAWDFISSGKLAVDDIYCLISDIEMPNMDGMTLCRKIKEDDKLSNIKVALFSSLLTDEVKLKGQAVGADLQINKPDLATLLSALKHFAN